MKILNSEFCGFRVRGSQAGTEGRQDSHVDELGLPPNQQMLLVDELEPVHQHVILTAFCKPDAH